MFQNKVIKGMMVFLIVVSLILLLGCRPKEEVKEEVRPAVEVGKEFPREIEKPVNWTYLTITTTLEFEEDDIIDIKIDSPINFFIEPTGVGIKEGKEVPVSFPYMKKDTPYIAKFAATEPLTVGVEAAYYFKFNAYTIFKTSKRLIPGTNNTIVIDRIEPVCLHEWCRPLCSRKIATTDTKVKGVIVDSITGKPLPWAEILFSRTSLNEFGEREGWGESFFCLTDFDGRFELDVEPDPDKPYINLIIRNNYLNYIRAEEEEIVLEIVDQGDVWDIGEIRLTKAPAIRYEYKEGIYTLEYNDASEKKVGLGVLKIVRDKVGLVGEHLDLELPYDNITIRCSESYELERVAAQGGNVIFVNCVKPLSTSAFHRLLEGLMKHELMHMYVSKVWLPHWFNEGFATHEEALLLEKEGKEEAVRCTLSDRSSAQVADKCILDYTFTGPEHPAEYESSACFYSALKRGGDINFLHKLLRILEEEKYTIDNYGFVKALIEASGVSRGAMISLLTENYGCRDREAEIRGNI